ncbi:40-residue YVTN family beta-propeller repeat protein [Candidatus Sulfotelmatobacter kueseliae]|uniref:40-residue YVTN family beta-propeller repeat protein n=1 Tax=Candidatus Sulfotelmatobacter kueseliae TaxID=2042962 RepID=A0A2U3KJ16_9BACT|nr:40-residue YVTN family beta-propeller repeat protein [Candidatus Sulfotelmatobacter kueseliae]
MQACSTIRARIWLGARITAILAAALIGIAAQPAARQAPAIRERYLSPIEMTFSSDGRLLYVVCEGSDEVRVVDVQSGKVENSIPVGHVPRGIAISPDGRQLYITNAWSDSVSVIDTTSLKVVETLPTGFEPAGVVADRSGTALYVANRLSGDVSVIDLRAGQEAKRLLAGRGASYLALSPDGKQVYCTHIYPNPGAHRTPPNSEITVIDTARQIVVERKPLHNVAGVFHVALSADGRLGVVAQLRPKNLIPLAHVEHGWVFGDSLTLFGEDVGEPVQIPLDELDRYYALPWGVAIAPDKSKIFLTTAGAESVTVIDVSRLLKTVRTRRAPAGKSARATSFVNDLSASADYVLTRIPVGHNPRGVVLSPDGKRLYVANRLDDDIAVIDTTSAQVVSTMGLGGPKTADALRRGERLFYTADFAFQGGFGCSNCHLDATIDGLQWDLEPDGFGKDIVDNRSLEDLAGTEPFKWNGGNPDMPTECGPRTEKFFYRSQSFTPQELTDLVTFVYSLPYRPNRYRLANGQLTAAQERGKAIFERTKTKNGMAIPEDSQCSYCHSGPKYTNQRQIDVGTGKLTDRSPVIDVPQLPNVAYSAPYLHDGSARSLEEIWTVFNPKDTHGVTNDLTKDELNDLVEYLKTL